MRRATGVAIATSLSVAVLAQTPTGQTAEPLRLVSLSHFIHATEHLETTLAFYKAVFDVDAAPPRVNANPGVALLNNKPGIGLRASSPKFPGDTFGIEMTDFSNVDKKGGQARGTDPGAIELILPVRDLDAQYTIALPEDPAYATVGGFVLDQLGFIPRGGESFEYGLYRFSVMEMDGRRVARVKIQRLREPEERKAEAATASTTVAVSKEKPNGKGR